MTPPTSTPVPDAAALVAESAASLRTVRSTQFHVAHEVGSMYLPEFSAKITDISGAWDADTGAALSIDAYLVSSPETDAQSGSYVEVLAVVTPQGYFSTEPISGLWLKQPAASAPFSVTRLQHIVADLVEAVENPVFVGAETVDDVATYRIRGGVPASAMDWLPISASAGQSLQIDVWTDSGNKAGRESYISVRPDRSVSSTLPIPIGHLRLTGIGEPAEISPPEQFIDLSGG